MPDTIAIYDPRMHLIIAPAAKLKKLAGGAKHSEGAVYLPQDDSVIFSDVSGDRLFRWSAADGVSIIRESGFYYQNGNYLDLEGRIVSCSHGKRAIIRQEHNGEWQVICDRCLDARSLAPYVDAGSHRYQNNRLNSPNDLVVKSDAARSWEASPLRRFPPL